MSENPINACKTTGLWRLGGKFCLLGGTRSRVAAPPHGKEPFEMGQACPTRWIHWMDYIFQVAWEHLSIPLEELEDVVGESEVWASGY